MPVRPASVSDTNYYSENALCRVQGSQYVSGQSGMSPAKSQKTSLIRNELYVGSEWIPYQSCRNAAEF